MKVNLPSLPTDLINPVKKMRQRAADWAPLEPHFRGIIQKGLQGVPKTESANSTGKLDDSIRNLSIWRMGKQSIEWGTDIDYIYAHMAWRKKSGEDQVWLLGKGVQTQMLQLITRYITEGRR